MINPELRAHVENSLSARAGTPVHIAGIRNVSGGCISQAAILTLSNGESAFLKWNDSAPLGLFRQEAIGLNELRHASPLRIPVVYDVSGLQESRQYLLLEDISRLCADATHSVTESFDEALGRGLAEQHRNTSEQFGFHRNNFIGSTPQKNDWHRDWPEFFRSRRIEPLLELLVQQGRLSSEDRHLFDRLLERLDDLVATDETPALLHGDLWSGNILRDGNGRPALIDPAVYYGHREADIAFTRLFGGLSGRALQAYHEAWPLQSGYEKRGDLYNLYHLLNHAVLFGGSYLAQARSVASRYL